MQAVAWVMTREADVVLRASLDPFDVERATTAPGDKTELWDDKPGLAMISLERRVGQLDPSYDAYSRADLRAIADLVDALRRGTVVASGEPYDKLTDVCGKRVRLTPLDWASLTLGEHRRGMRQVDWYNDLSGVMQAQVWAGQWRSLLIETASLVKRWPERPPPKMPAERGLHRWLLDQMKGDPTASRSKDALRSAATAAGHYVSGKGFNRAWANARQTEGVSDAWGKGGAKPKPRTNPPT